MVNDRLDIDFKILRDYLVEHDDIYLELFDRIETEYRAMEKRQNKLIEFIDKFYD